MDKLEAIEELEQELTLCSELSDPDLKDALLLAIEALKRCIALEQTTISWATRPLPGETLPTASP